MLPSFLVLFLFFGRKYLKTADEENDGEAFKNMY